MTEEKVALFIDGANMFYAQKKLGWSIDYEKLYKYFAQGKQVYNAFFYIGSKNRKGEKSFFTKLAHLGYTVRTKEVKKIFGNEGKIIEEKCNLDIEIVIDMLNTVGNYDEAVIFSGDSDFERAIELLRSRSKKIIVVSTKGMIASDLINAADRYIDLKDLRSQIENLKKMPCT